MSSSSLPVTTRLATARLSKIQLNRLLSILLADNDLSCRKREAVIEPCDVFFDPTGYAVVLHINLSKCNARPQYAR